MLPATGPYKISAYQPQRRLILVRNHWFQPREGRPDGYPDRIVWRLDSSSVERATQDVLHGRADYLLSSMMPADLVARLAVRHAQPTAHRADALAHVPLPQHADPTVQPAHSAARTE